MQVLSTWDVLLLESVHCGLCRGCYKCISDALFALVDNYLLLCHANEVCTCTCFFCSGRTRSQIHLVGDYYFTLGIRTEPRRKPLPTTGSSDGAPDGGATGPDSAFSDDPLPPKPQEPEMKPLSPVQESATPARPPKPSPAHRTSGSRRFRTPRKSAKRQRRTVPKVLKEPKLGVQSAVAKEEEEKQDGSTDDQLVHPATVDESDEDLNVSRHNRSDRSRVISDSDEQEGGAPPTELPQDTPSLPSAAEVEAPLSSWAPDPTLQSASEQEVEAPSQTLDKGDTVHQQDEPYPRASGAWPEQVPLQQESVPAPATPHTSQSYQPLPSPQYHASPPPNLHHDSNPDLSQWADPGNQPQRTFVPSQSGDLGVQPMAYNPQSFEPFGTQMQQPREQQHQTLPYNPAFAPLSTTRVPNTAAFPDSYPAVNPGFPGAHFFRPFTAGYQPGQYSVTAVRPPFEQTLFQHRFQYQFLSGQHPGLGRELPTRPWGPQHAFQQLSTHRHGSQSPGQSHSPQPASTTSGGSRYSINDLLGATPNSTSATPTATHQEVHQVQPPPPHEAPPHFLAARVNPRGNGGGSFDTAAAAEYNRLMQQQAARQWLFHQARHMAGLQRSASPNVYHMGASHPFIPSLGGQTLGTAPQDLLPSNEEDAGP